MLMSFYEGELAGNVCKLLPLLRVVGLGELLMQDQQFGRTGHKVMGRVDRMESVGISASISHCI